MGDYAKDARKYVGSHKAADVHPEVPAAMHRFDTADKADAGDAALAAHGRALMDMVESLGDDNAPEDPDPRYAWARGDADTGRRPAAKKSAAKRAAGGRSRS